MKCDKIGPCYVPVRRREEWITCMHHHIVTQDSPLPHSNRVVASQSSRTSRASAGACWSRQENTHIVWRTSVVGLLIQLFTAKLRSWILSFRPSPLGNVRFLTSQLTGESQFIEHYYQAFSSTSLSIAKTSILFGNHETDPTKQVPRRGAPMSNSDQAVF
jgi:hypothetical protein